MATKFNEIIDTAEITIRSLVEFSFLFSVIVVQKSIIQIWRV